MKRTSTQRAILCIALLTLGLSGCKNDDTSQAVVSAEAKLYADMEYAYRGELNIAWNDGDVLGVFAAETQNGQFPLSARADYAFGSFAGQIKGDPGIYYAYYPYDAATKLQGTMLSVKIPEIQTYRAGNFSPNQNPMVGVSDSPRMQFKNLCGVLGIPIISETDVIIRSVVFEAGEGDRAAGDAFVDLNYGTESPALIMSETASHTVTLNAPQGGIALTKGGSVMLYLALAPQTYAGGGICA